MCRICQFNRQALEWLLIDADADYLSPYLEQLIKSNGGDGNGVAALGKRGKNIAWLKDTKLSVPDMIEFFLEEYYTGAQSFTFHTRRASFGVINSDNCHPFIFGDTLLVHNGHDTAMIAQAEKAGYKHNGEPDSHAGAFLVSKYGPDVLKPFSGTFVGYHNGKPFRTLGDGYWPLWHIQGINQYKNVSIHCSERPWHLTETCYHATDLRPYKVPAMHYGHFSNSRYTTDALNCWNGTSNKQETALLAGHNMKQVSVHAENERVRNPTRPLTLAALEIDEKKLTEQDWRDIAAHAVASYRRYKQDDKHNLKVDSSNQKAWRYMRWLLDER